MPSKGNVLIIEDNASNAEMAVDLLEDAGYKTFHSFDVDGGLELARRYHPDVILMDMFIPDKSGMDTIPVIKNDPELRDIPLVAFTALGLDEERMQLTAQGCTGVISKPIDVSTFVETVAGFFSRQPKGSKTMQPVPPSPPRAEVKPEMKSSEDLEHAQHELKETIALLSHDLQAPARKIHQFCDILLSSDATGLSAENRSWVERIDRSSQQMLDTLAKSMERMATL